jgi:hypothetical protein
MNVTSISYEGRTLLGIPGLNILIMLLSRLWDFYLIQILYFLMCFINHWYGLGSYQSWFLASGFS